MHHALNIHEILLNIFAHCNPLLVQSHGFVSPFGDRADLVALAGTCRMFKEPALDVLWSELPDLCPLARCLPKVSYQLIPGFQWYSFRRPLEQVEWDTLRSYTRRVRSILDFGSAFRPECVRKFLSLSTSEALFPNLRYLRCVFAKEITPLLHQPLPSLVSLDYSFLCEETLPLLWESLEYFPTFSPNMKKLAIRLHQPGVMVDTLVSDCIRRWSNPETVYCPRIALNANALIHLSHVLGLTRLSFALRPDAVPPSDTLLFSTLDELKLFSVSLEPISRFLVRIRLPVVTDFTVEFGSYPSKGNVARFWTDLQSTGINDSITSLRLTQIHHKFATTQSNPLILAADDLQPITTLRNLRHVDLNLGWNVGLTDSELLGLASAWPHLEHLLINEQWGWQTSGGITPDGLARLLQTCRSLRRLSLVLDTRDYTDVPPPHSPDANLCPSLLINVVDSVLDSASILAVAAFFTNLIPSDVQFTLIAWSSWAFTWREDREMYEERWKEVYVRMREAQVAARLSAHSC